MENKSREPQLIGELSNLQPIMDCRWR